MNPGKTSKEQTKMPRLCWKVHHRIQLFVLSSYTINCAYIDEAEKVGVSSPMQTTCLSVQPKAGYE